MSDIESEECSKSIDEEEEEEEEEVKSSIYSIVKDKDD